VTDENRQPAERATDVAGRTTVDPSRNVSDLVDSVDRRQDDLRNAESRHIRELLVETTKRMDDLRQLRAQYDSELRAAESARIDAIRAVDVGAVAAAAQVQATQATTLAAQVQSSAEAMRTQVETTRLQLQAQYSAALEPIIKDVTDLRRVQYETAGGKAQTVEGRSVDDAARGDKASNTSMILVVVAIVAVMASVFIGMASIAVTLILHG
jgi:hypothetical protein